ncbi:MAG TPA: RcpC/CpaB family pilus assembly protein [Actinomycetota bacterium]|nr:RcpC/CpaB family pilus assembly protein [Actinomycetota bacterium]
MRSRGLVVALALLLAIGATAAVFLYVNGVKENAVSNGDLETVVVSTQDIAANADLSALRGQGVFETKQIPADTKLESAVTDPSQLEGKTATSPILAGEQIPLERLSGGEQFAGGRYNICETCVALTVRVDGPRGVGGVVQQGDFVTLYATFEGLKVFSSTRDLLDTLQGRGNPSQQQTQPAQVAELPSFTMTVEPTVKVLRVENPTVGTTGTDASQEKTSEGDVTLTLDVPRADAQFVIYTMEKGALWFGLLPPDQQGLQLPAQSISIDRFLGKKQS